MRTICVGSTHQGQAQSRAIFRIVGLDKYGERMVWDDLSDIRTDRRNDRLNAAETGEFYLLDN